MVWANLSAEIAEEFHDAQHATVEDIRLARWLLETYEARRRALTDAARWKNTKCIPDQHARRKEQNLRASHKYLEKNRAAHNARQRERDRAKAARKSRAESPISM